MSPSSSSFQCRGADPLREPPPLGRSDKSVVVLPDVARQPQSGAPVFVLLHSVEREVDDPGRVISIDDVDTDVGAHVTGNDVRERLSLVVEVLDGGSALHPPG